MIFKGVYLGWLVWVHRFQTDSGEIFLARAGEFTQHHQETLEGNNGRRCRFECRRNAGFGEATYMAITSPDITFL
ncbi:MAG: hypothetical protein UV78_C0029G0019 [Parcubacteria group bacterium GW2011_GWA2_43_17]|nr:MAG: hypothetical protein UV78_C0029G0019 [Parcubacteria group bacterium GW2011_GWA2_43_17]KKT94314.1 MAG: hypothetical protein UW91_C0003G0018 [Parcubacteria group bacterium GW2011_GWF2_45_11]OGY93576.1 MAG: hypothetical protein A2260_03025 [Candidatus Komeilibacteria bacterium RIFOXYA2_FULL_45_9]OGY93914.1 MAG: hypothetical protein A3J95_01580 [Candidatus Komeilibacteria bacterium RIFOXYC2_FULL_45_12]HAH04435.1 hypothetical protein [Candidatus Komeilibacteria bacterium]